jgi:hypothetical protein
VRSVQDGGERQCLIEERWTGQTLLVGFGENQRNAGCERLDGSAVSGSGELADPEQVRVSGRRNTLLTKPTNGHPVKPTRVRQEKLVRIDA